MESVGYTERDNRKLFKPEYLSLFGESMSKMKIELHKAGLTTRKELKITGKTTILKLLSNLKITPDSVIIFKDGEPIPIDDEICDNDSIKIVDVLSRV